jgi:sugar lactone lactonase YvrE
VVISIIQPSSSQSDRISGAKASIDGPTALALDNNGHLYVIEEEQDKVLRIDLGNGTISTAAGFGRKADCVHRDGIQATKACLHYPVSLAVDSSGNLFIGEMAGYVRKVDARTGLISTVAGTGQSGDTVKGSSAVSADFWSIDGLAIDAEGDLFIADAHQGRIFKLDHTNGRLYPVAGNGKPGFAGDGEPALKASFRFGYTISLDHTGSLLIADYGNCRIRRVEHSSGIVQTIAVTGKVTHDGSCSATNLEPGPYPSDAVGDSIGNLYFVEGAMDIVRRVDAKTLKLSTVAGSGIKGYCGDGGLATLAQLNNPSGLAIDRDGNLYISEFVNNRIRRVDATSTKITTIAGNGFPHRIDIHM